MKRMKKWISFLLVLAVCHAFILPDAGQVSASETDTRGQTVQLKQTEHGKIRFADSAEDMETPDLGRYSEGDTVPLEIEPEEGFGLGKIQVLDIETEEELQIEEMAEENHYSFVMGTDSVVASAVFEEKEEPAESQEEPAEEEAEKYVFPYEGYIWGKDSRRIDTGKSARLVGGSGTIEQQENPPGSRRKLRSAVGSEVVIRPGTAHSYGSWSTCEFTVTTASGQYLGYCAQPNLGTPNGTYRISELDNEVIKAALLIAPGGVPEMYENYGKGIYNERDNNVYAYAHALIGYLYMGSLKRLSASMAAGVQNMAAVVNQRSQNPLDPNYELFQSYLKQYKVYVADTGSSDVQDIVWLEKNPVGYAKLKKTSANPEITEGNNCYSLAGAQYGVFCDSGCTQRSAVLTTDAAGNSDTASLDAGMYYVKEITAAKGYLLDPRVYPVQVSAGETAELAVCDEPVTAPPVLLYKVDRETKETSPLGAASLENTQFKVNFYRGYYSKENLPATADRSWIIKAGEMKLGKGAAARAAGREKPVKVSGDSFYQVGEDIILPLGTISVEEIQAPTGYQLDSSYVNPSDGGQVTEAVHVAKVVQNGTQGAVEDGTEYRVADSVIRGDFELTKIDKNTQRPISGVPFRITSKTTKESHVIMTDENGHYSSNSAYAAHSYRTNGGQAGDGLWFGLDADGRNVTVDDQVGALPYDTYTIEELKCDANEDKFLYSGSFTISKADYIVNLGNIENADIAIETTAKDEATGTHYALAEEVTLIDTVSYIGLQKGKTYRLYGTLMNRTTSQPVTDEDGDLVTAAKTFVPKDSNGQVEVEISFDASKLQGNDVVVFEELYLGDEKLAEHADINDDGQTIHFPAIGTQAADDQTGSNLAKADEEITIVDTVSYENLRAGKKYKITGTLMDKKTGRAVLDDNGSKVESETAFTAKTASGTVEVVFRFPGRKLAGKTLVAFESLEKDNREYAVHHDITDEAQTVYIPKIGTSVQDDETKSHISRADAEVTLMDEVEYENLIPGREYVLKGILMNPETKKEAVDAKGNKITAQSAFTPTQKNGSAKVTFRFDASQMAGKTAVVYEELLYNGKVIAEHKDLKDEEQTVQFPSIETEASDRDTGKGISYADQSVTIEDVVHYENLIPGKKYTVQGVLMDQASAEPLKDAKGKEITAKKEFTAKEAVGDVTVVFEFDGSVLAGKTMVAFEELFAEKKSIAVHADLYDEAQTIEFPKITTQAVDSKTGLHLTMAADEIEVTDTVSYQKLIPGCGYRLEGVLMDQKTRKPALDAKGNKIQAEREFVPKEADGTVELKFRFPGNGLEGHTFVVYEELLLEKSWFQDETVGIHQDIMDEAQTIYIPEIGTAAHDQDTGMRISRADEDVTLIDEVKYKNLVPGQEYVLKGILMNPETGKAVEDANGKKVTAQKAFTPAEKEGSVEVVLKLDGRKLAGETVVVYEELLYQNHRIAEHKDSRDEKQTVHFPKIATTAEDQKTGEHISFAEEQVTLEDVVHYENLIPGKKYTVSGTLMDQATGEPLWDAEGKEITAMKEFTPKEAKGDVTVTFEFDGSLLAGKVTVAFEELFADKKSVAVHADIKDAPQTVKFPEIRTQALDPKTGTNMAMAAEEMSIVDTVSYRNLIPGCKYHLQGILMDQDTGEAARDSDGEEIHADMTFVPEEEDGAVELTFCFPGKDLEGHTFVVFEELFLKKSWTKEVTAAVHKDIEDEAQTIHIPKVWTQAADDETLTRQAMADGQIGVTDMVYYSNVMPGYEYTVKGILMDRKTGEELKDDQGEAVAGEVTFTADEAEGEIPVGFSFSGASLAGKTAVIFETLVYEDTPVAGHEDLEEEKQSIYFPEIKTSATNKEDSSKELLIQDMVTITDRVEYENLIPGTEYRMKGTVMDKAAGEPFKMEGEPVTAEVVFQAEKPSGSIEIDFTFQTKGLEEKELVVFEKLTMTENEEEVARHEDLKDQDQTVRLVKRQGSSKSAKTGDDSLGKIWIFTILAAASGMTAILSVEKRTRRKRK